MRSLWSPQELQHVTHGALLFFSTFIHSIASVRTTILTGLRCSWSSTPCQCFLASTRRHYRQRSTVHLDKFFHDCPEWFFNSYGQCVGVYTEITKDSFARFNLSTMWVPGKKTKVCRPGGNQFSLLNHFTNQSPQPRNFLSCTSLVMFSVLY